MVTTPWPPTCPSTTSSTLDDYADVVIEAVGDHDDVIVVGQSFGAFTAPLVADRLPATGLVLVAGMAPRPGERPEDWWTKTGYAEAASEQAATDGGLTGNDDPLICYYHDVPDELARWRTRQGSARILRWPPSTQPWPLDRLAGRAHEVRALRSRTGCSRPASSVGSPSTGWASFRRSWRSGHCPALGPA